MPLRALPTLGLFEAVTAVGSPGTGDDPARSFTVYAVTKDEAKPTVFCYESGVFQAQSMLAEQYMHSRQALRPASKVTLL